MTYTLDGEPRFPICPACGDILFTDGVAVGRDIYCGWCAQQHKQDAANDQAIEDERAATYRPTMPSRDFLVRQAVLNALAEQFPVITAVLGAPKTMRWYLQDRRHVEGSELHSAILRHFRTLRRMYA